MINKYLFLVVYLVTFEPPYHHIDNRTLSLFYSLKSFFFSLWWYNNDDDDDDQKLCMLSVICQNLVSMEPPEEKWDNWKHPQIEVDFHPSIYLTIIFVNGCWKVFYSYYYNCCCSCSLYRYRNIYIYIFSNEVKYVMLQPHHILCLFVCMFFNELIVKRSL